MELTRFFALLVLQMVVILLPYLWASVLLGAVCILGIAYFRHPVARSLRFIGGIYLVSLIFLAPLIIIESWLFGYRLAQLDFVLALYIKSYLSLCLIVGYRHIASLAEVMAVLQRLRTPTILLSTTLYVLFFMHRLSHSVQTVRNAYRLRVYTRKHRLRLRILLSMVLNIMRSSLNRLDDVHSTVILRKLYQPVPFDILYQYEKRFASRKTPFPGDAR